MFISARLGVSCASRLDEYGTCGLSLAVPKIGNESLTNKAGSLNLIMANMKSDSNQATPEAVHPVLDKSVHDGGMPLWAKALATNPAVLQEVATERRAGYRLLTQEEQAMVSCACALITGYERGQQQALARLRGLAWSDQQVMSYLMTVGAVMRRVTIVAGLGISTPSDTSNVIVSLPDLDADLAKEVRASVSPVDNATEGQDTPKWVLAMSHQPEMLRRVLRDPLQVGTTENRAMIQVVAGALMRATTACLRNAAAKLRTAGWSDAKMVELVTMVGTEERDRMIFSGAGA